MRAAPPGRSTLCISRRAPSGSEKFLKAAQQTAKSKLSSSNGIEEALPSRKSTAAPASAALVRAISTKVSLTSSPVTV